MDQQLSRLIPDVAVNPENIHGGPAAGEPEIFEIRAIEEKKWGVKKEEDPVEPTRMVSVDLHGPGEIGQCDQRGTDQEYRDEIESHAESEGVHDFPPWGPTEIVEVIEKKQHPVEGVKE